MHNRRMDYSGLQRLVRVYDGDLDPALCEQLVGSFKSAQALHERNGRGVRPGLERSAWTELNLTRAGDPGLLRLFRSKIDLALTRYNRDVPLTLALPSSPKTADLIVKEYRAGTGEAFQVHFDSIYDVSNRYLVFLWYLNDVTEGGETEFPDLPLRVEARRGRLLMFPPYWMFQHAGLPPRSGDKYILSSYLLF
jgi:prolyl 4-hydroxylase